MIFRQIKAAAWIGCYDRVDLGRFLWVPEGKEDCFSNLIIYFYFEKDCVMAEPSSQVSVTDNS